MTKPTFEFTVEEVFYIKPPVDRVIVVGTVLAGEVRPGDHATVESRTGPVSVVVEGIEGIRASNINHASKGEQVGLELRGITTKQAYRRDWVIGVGSG